MATSVSKAKSKSKNPFKNLNRSERARKFAEEYARLIKAGKHVNKTALQIKHGYKPHSARVRRVFRTVTFKETIGPLEQAVAQARYRALVRLPKTERKAGYRALVEGVEKLTKVHQLLTGGATANVNLVARHLSDADLEKIARGQMRLPIPDDKKES